MSLILRGNLNRKITGQELDQNFTFLLSQITQTGSGATGPQGPTGPQGATGPSMTDVTYSELLSKITGSELTPGSFYKVTDFKTAYDQPDYDVFGDAISSEENYKVGPTNSLVVLAIDVNNISDQAWQPDYPNDFIKWDWTFNQTEITGGTAWGRITERIDEFGNRTDFDHRSVVFKRYKHYKIDRTQNLGGTFSVTSIVDNLYSVSGTGTTFSELNENGYISFENLAFKIEEILGDTTMVISSVATFSNSFNIDTWYEAIPLVSNLPGDIYYFSDYGDSYSIYDGGMDMYDDANIMFTDLESQINYTHTQLDTEYDEGVPANLFIMDGEIVSGATSAVVFGTGSSYFTNMYPGLFVMCAATVSISSFGIDGNIGTDGNGLVDVLQFTHSVGPNLYSAFVKRVYDTSDPSINQIIIVPGDITGITQSYDETTQDDLHRLDGIDDRDKVYYLLMALRQGVKLTDSEVREIVGDFLDIADGLSLESLLIELNSNYELVTDTKSLNFLYTSHLMSNIVDDDFMEYPLFVGSSSNNWFENVANLYPNRSDFILANNVFLSDVNNNSFKQLCINNTFTDYVSDNQFGSGFFFNQIFGEMTNNKIGDYFEGNKIYKVFESNNVGNYAYDNIIDAYIYNNSFGDNFYSNSFNVGEAIENNTIRNQFNNNTIEAAWFGNNKISDFFVDNTIKAIEFSGNNINSDFNQNNINVFGFFNNNINSSFQSNIISAESFDSNVTGEFNDNNIDNDFIRNQFLNEFSLNSNDGIIVTDNIFECRVVEYSLNASSASYLFSDSATAHVSKNIDGVEVIWWINSGGTMSSELLD